MIDNIVFENPFFVETHFKPGGADVKMMLAIYLSIELKTCHSATKRNASQIQSNQFFCIIHRSGLYTDQLSESSGIFCFVTCVV